MIDVAHLHRFTTEQFLAIPDLPDRLELIEGVICDMAPEGPQHAVALGDVYFALRSALPDRLVVPGGSVVLDETNAPIPDVAVYRETPPDGATSFIVDNLLLVVEVGVTTVDFDRREKLVRYGAAGVPEVWLVQPANGFVRVCTGPRPVIGYQNGALYDYPAQLDHAVRAFAERQTP